MILHCLERKSKSNRYDEDDIISTDETGVFKVKKGDVFKHTVDFLKPSCSCKDWIRWNISCKHFFAVFNLKVGWDWNALPREYRENPYLQADDDAILHYFDDPVDTNEQQMADHVRDD